MCHGKGWQRLLSGSNRLGRVASGKLDALVGVEQAGNGGKDFSVGRTSWEGWQAESGTPRLSSSERAPAGVDI